MTYKRRVLRWSLSPSSQPASDFIIILGGRQPLLSGQACGYLVSPRASPVVV